MKKTILITAVVFIVAIVAFIAVFMLLSDDASSEVGTWLMQPSALRGGGHVNEPGVLVLSENGEFSFTQHVARNPSGTPMSAMWQNAAANYSSNQRIASIDGFLHEYRVVTEGTFERSGRDIHFTFPNDTTTRYNVNITGGAEAGSPFGRLLRRFSVNNRAVITDYQLHIGNMIFQREED